MTIKSFPYGIPFSSSYALSASYVVNTSDIGSASASLAEFVTGFTGPTGASGSTIDNNGQFTIVPSYNIQFIGSAHNPVGAPTFPSHSAGDLIILYGETTQSFAPILSSSAILNGWAQASSGTSPSRILAVKFASSSIETFPSFSGGANPINNLVLVYKNVDKFNAGGTSVACSNCFTMNYAGATAPNFTQNRDHWILLFQLSTNSINSLTPAEAPRSGFVNRLLGYSGSTAAPNSRLYAIHDSNAVTSSISSGGTIAVNNFTTYSGFSYVLRASLNYSQFES